MSTYKINSLKWLAPVAMIGALGLAACGRDSASNTVEASSGNRAAQAAEAERYVDLQLDRAKASRAARGSACIWTSDIGNTPVLPPSDLGMRPAEDSVLIFEQCDGEWTGAIAWLSE